MLHLKPFFLILFLTLFVSLLTTSCSETDSGSSIGGGNYDKTGVTPVDEFPENPIALLGIYNVTSQILDGTPQAVTSGSEFRVNVDTTRLGSNYVDVLVRITINDKTVEFERAVALSGKEIGPAFFEEIFTEMGAKVTGKYTLEFTLASTSYSELVMEGIIQDGETLVLNLDKNKNLEIGDGLDIKDTQDEVNNIPVESVRISGMPVKVVHGDKDFKLTADVLPSNADNKAVIFSSSHPNNVVVDNQGNVSIKKYTDELVTITAISKSDRRKTDIYSFLIEKAQVTNVTINPSNLILPLKQDGSKVTGTLTTVIEPSVATEYADIQYKSNNTNIVTVDNEGVATAHNVGSTTITVTVGNITKTVTVTVEAAPTSEIKVTGINITSVAKTYKKGSEIQVNFQLTPSNTTDRSVSYSTPSGKHGTVIAVNGQGTITLANVQTAEALTVTTQLNHSKTYNLEVVDEISNLSFTHSSHTVEQGQSFTNVLTNSNAIKSSSSSITYSTGDSNIATVNHNGQVTGLKNGVTTITVTVQPKYESAPLTASYEVDVLGHIDYTDENSIQGTYDIVFFGTNTNHTGLAKAIITNNCDIYNSLWNATKCPDGTGGYAIPDKDFAGRAIIKLVNNNIIVHTKVGFVGNRTIQSMSAADQYQYTVYDSRTLNGLQDTNLTGNMDGRTLSAKSTISNAKYYFEKDKSYNTKSNLDILLFSHFDGKKASFYTVNPDTRLILRKVSSKVIPMDPNSLTEEPFNKLSGLSLNSTGNITVN